MTTDAPWRILALANEWVRHAETKAAAILTGAGIAGTLIYQLVQEELAPSPAFAAVALAAAAFTMAATVAAAATLWPRLANSAGPPSLLYFHDIARYQRSAAEYAGAMRKELDGDDLFDEVARQILSNARVAHKKYRWARLSLICFLPAIGLIGALAMLSLTTR